MLRDVNDQGLEDRIVVGGGLVAVAFLDYCSIPCDHFRPELNAVAEKMDGKVDFYRLDVTENPTITNELSVEAVPTLVVFRDGEELARYEGPYSREALGDRLAALLAGRSSAP